MLDYFRGVVASLVVARYQTVVHGTDNPTLAAAEAPTPSDGDEDEAAEVRSDHGQRHEEGEILYCYRRHRPKHESQRWVRFLELKKEYFLWTL